jgi:hypothetical protein
MQPLIQDILLKSLLLLLVVLVPYFREQRGKTQKSTNNLMSTFGLIEKYGAVSYLLSCNTYMSFIAEF